MLRSRSLQLGTKVSGTDAKVSGTDEVAPSSIFERVFIRHAGGYAIANPRRLKPSGGAYYRPRKFRGSFMVDFVRRRSWYSRDLTATRKSNFAPQFSRKPKLFQGKLYLYM
jgi:hypothetical protein